MSHRNLYGSASFDLSILPSSLLQARAAALLQGLLPGHSSAAAAAAAHVPSSQQQVQDSRLPREAADALPDYLLAAAARANDPGTAARPSAMPRAAAPDPPGEHVGTSVRPADDALKSTPPAVVVVPSSSSSSIAAAGSAAADSATADSSSRVNFLSSAVAAVEAADAAAERAKRKESLSSSSSDRHRHYQGAATKKARTGRSWDEYFGALVSFHARQGHSNITVKTCPQDLELVEWVREQCGRRIVLSTDQRYKLDLVGFWKEQGTTSGRRLPTAAHAAASLSRPAAAPSSSIYDTFAETKSALQARNIFAALEQCKQKYAAPTQIEQQLAARDREKKIPMQLTGDQLEELEEDSDELWFRMFQSLRAYRERRGHCRITPETTRGDQVFGVWAVKQRDLYQRRLLSKERQAKLDAIGFDWGEREVGSGAGAVINPEIHVSISKGGEEKRPRKRMRSFEENFGALLEYKKVHGNCDVPQKRGKLGIWVKNVRQHPNRFTEKHRTRLDSIGFKWRKLQLDEQWVEAFQQLVQYRDKYGDCNVPSRWKKSPALARWVHTQRTMYRRDKLLEDRKDKLEEAGFVWDCNAMREDEAFHENYEKLVAYKRAHNHCNLPSKYRRDRPLGRWAAKMRELYVCDQLDADRSKALNDIEFVWKIAAGAGGEDGSTEGSDSDTDSDNGKDSDTSVLM